MKFHMEPRTVVSYFKVCKINDASIETINKTTTLKDDHGLLKLINVGFVWCQAQNLKKIPTLP